MKKYCFILDKETGLVQLGAGCSNEYYQEIGMEERDVQQSDIDFKWYLTEKCPMQTEDKKTQEREKEFYKSFFKTSLGWIRRGVTISNTEKTRVDFLTDLLPSIALGVNMGQDVTILAYDQPPFDKDVEDWAQYQHREKATAEFIQECLMQTVADFGG